ncbi:p12 [Matsumuraeses phaseoli granulovirus]|uniref:P12 n=1 Tax=Matsumuraeses phaseoli granulovirus TaxID=2760664 RepID=A0AAE7MLD6_9BBAC|nr:p12 [Matsumuraeses phaseoli granulovirus]QOD40038.1 p12 [Matsumuraeses phaseoli granulovirus]
MEDSLFSRQDYTSTTSRPPPVNNEALLQALLTQGVSRQIKLDKSLGKQNILKKLAPKTRGLKRLLHGLDEVNDDQLLIRGADDAVDLLETIYSIANNKFVLHNDLEIEESNE